MGPFRGSHLDFLQFYACQRIKKQVLLIRLEVAYTNSEQTEFSNDRDVPMLVTKIWESAVRKRCREKTNNKKKITFTLGLIFKEVL